MAELFLIISQVISVILSLLFTLESMNYVISLFGDVTKRMDNLELKINEKDENNG